MGTSERWKFGHASAADSDRSNGGAIDSSRFFFFYSKDGLPIWPLWDSLAWCIHSMAISSFTHSIVQATAAFHRFLVLW